MKISWGIYVDTLSLYEYVLSHKIDPIPVTCNLLPVYLSIKWLVWKIEQSKVLDLGTSELYSFKSINYLSALLIGY